jgi:hypothetical protein
MTIKKTTQTTITCTLFELIRAAAEDGDCLSFEGNPTTVLLNGKPESLDTTVTFMIEEGNESSDS